MVPANELTASQARKAMVRGDLTAETLLQSCLDRISARDDVVKAWCHLAAETTLVVAKELDRGGRIGEKGSLAGLPVGVKDIIDTVDMPTTYGSAVYPDHRPSMDAACVALVRAAGGIALGKTVSTEFAYFQPGYTTNPHNPGHTPGGSSSGSAAAVADFMVPFAFGTQTGGSVIRPAAFCGVVGYKASYGALPLYGVKALSHDLDTLGWFCREVADIHLMRAALVGAPSIVPDAELNSAQAPKIGLCRTYEWDQADEDCQAAVLAAAKNLEAAGAEVVDVTLPPSFADLVESQKRVMAQNAARDLAFEYHQHRDRMSRHIIALIEEGQSVDFAIYQQDVAATEAGRGALHAIFDQVDVLLCPSAPGEAPKGLDGTGDPIFNRLWTLLGNPCVNLPGHIGGNGLPVGVQAVGAMGQDEALLAHCRWMEQRII
ncbi:MAG: amidase [Rhodospirillaceae bacterium]|nr:amidase [Rhodospirillaceae bacterium]MBT5080078.1 amidase [Rhodospirillaceae bacterium]MBT6987484.1 amidase [Rhodospirillaceae bacterium]MBT7978691.1 amidase [Rhodospirillaceae bacterium]